jgi:hypothetical protein
MRDVDLSRERRGQRKKRDGETGGEKQRDTQEKKTKRTHLILIRMRCPPRRVRGPFIYMRDTYRRCSGGIGEKGVDERVVVAQDAQDNLKRRMISTK